MGASQILPRTKLYTMIKLALSALFCLQAALAATTTTTTTATTTTPTTTTVSLQCQSIYDCKILTAWTGYWNRIHKCQTDDECERLSNETDHTHVCKSNRCVPKDKRRKRDITAQLR